MHVSADDLFLDLPEDALDLLSPLSLEEAVTQGALSVVLLVGAVVLETRIWRRGETAIVFRYGVVSLVAMLVVMQRDLGTPFPPFPNPGGSLVKWAQNGVLLLNTCLTVEDSRPASHARKGWEALTDDLLALVAATASPCVYLLWGAHAQAKAPLIEQAAAQHGREILVLQSNHPSPLSAARPPAPFLGSGCFLQARQWLAERGVAGVF